MQAIRDSVYSSFLYNKQRVQETILPLLPASLLLMSSPSSPSATSASAPCSPSSGGGSGNSGGCYGFLLKTSDPVMEGKVRALRSARAHVRQILRITSGPLLQSLTSISHSFSQLNSLVNELNSSRLLFASSCPAAAGSSLDVAASRASQLTRSSSEWSSVRGQGQGGSATTTTLDQQIRDVSQALKLLSLEADKMRTGIEFLNSNLSTLVNKAMADTLRTCDQLECSRIEFDAERNHLLSSMQQSPSVAANGSSSSAAAGMSTTTTRTRRRSSTSATTATSTTSSRISELEDRYVNLKRDVIVKMDFCPPIGTRS